MGMKAVAGLINRYILVIMIIVVFPFICLAGDQGYLIIKDNETFLDSDTGSPITWQNKIWLTQEKIKIENDQDKNRILLVYMDKNEIYQVDLNAKTYRRLDVPEGLKDLEGKREIKSNKLDKKRKFGEWDCYGVTMSTKANDISLEAEYWLTMDVNIPFPLRKKVAKYFGLDQENLTQELAKYEGYPVYVTLTMRVKDKKIKMNTMVMDVKNLEIDPNIFKIPSDFELIDAASKPKNDKPEDPNVIK